MNFSPLQESRSLAGPDFLISVSMKQEKEREFTFPFFYWIVLFSPSFPSLANPHPHLSPKELRHPFS